MTDPPYSRFTATNAPPKPHLSSVMNMTGRYLMTAFSAHPQGHLPRRCPPWFHFLNRETANLKAS